MLQKNIDLNVILLIFLVMFSILFNFVSWDSFSVARDDDVYYINSGIDLVSGKYAETRMPPFYPLLIGLFTKIIVDGFLSARLISAFFGAMLIVAVYFLGKEVYSKKTALLAAFLMTIFPHRIILSNAAKSESLYAFLAIASASLFLILLEGRQIRFALAFILGLLLSALYLTRPEGLLYAAVFIVFIFAYRNDYLNKKTAVNISVSLAVLVVFLASYIIFLHSRTGHWLLTGKYENLFFSDWVSSGGQWHQLNKLNEQANKIVFANPYHNIREAAVNAMARYAANFNLMLGVIGKMISPLLLICFGMGLIEMFQDVSGRKKKAYLLFLLLPVFIYPFFHIKGDYLFPSLLPLLIISARGLLELGRLINFGRVIIFISVLVITLNFLGDFQSFSKSALLALPREKRTIGLWMKDNLANGNIMDIEPISAFYAQMPYIMLPYDGFERVMKYAKENNVAYLMLAERDKNKYHPEIAALFDIEKKPVGLELIKSNLGKNGFFVLVFIILP